MILFVIYFVAVNLIAILLFAYDKHCAQRNKRRIPERTLHLWELFGGVFSIVFMMHIIHHKNKKSAYYRYTYLILLLWLIAIATYIYLKIIKA